MKKLLATAFLTLLLATSSFAGDILCPGVTGPQESPGITGPQESPGLTGDIQAPGFLDTLALLFGISWSG
ncbi:MAG TPA: hypothetical protein VJ464_30375 [Blastocatellia bacterium]|nr:hypothetical protein [Blastocatellia bacterium]